MRGPLIQKRIGQFHARGARKSSGPRAHSVVVRTTSLAGCCGAGARRLVEHLERAGFVAMKRPPIRRFGVGLKSEPERPRSPIL